ncbi:hypothetical protein D3C80_394640 [compost metagenome]
MKKIWNQINWLVIAFAATIAYITFIVWKVEFWKIWDFLSESRLNEIGDFLAGVFSPLAFIWLVAAVLTQRQELTETRDQFAENQKVVDAQLKTINEQSELLQQQHTLAEETAKKTYRLSLFDERFDIYSKLVAFHTGISKKQVFERSDLRQLQYIKARCGFVFSLEIEKNIEDIENSLMEFLDNQEEWESTWSRDAFNQIYEPQDKKSAAIKTAQNNHRDTILDSLHPISLQYLMRSSMRVSDN